MEIICKPKHNAIFWREPGRKVWNQAELTELIEDYDKSPTVFNLWQSVFSEKTGDFRYNVWECAACDNFILTVDEDPEYNYCPHCGRRIVPSYF